MPAETPLAVKPGPPIVTFETVTLELPALNVTLKMLVAPVFTLPKLRVDALAVRRPGVALTASVAVLLVTLPVELLTITANRLPLSVIVVGGVV
jgi:hypothetical protein